MHSLVLYLGYDGNIEIVKWCLHYGKKRAEIGSLKNAKYFFLFFETHQLIAIALM
jgi:hypothetical protein